MQRRTHRQVQMHIHTGTDTGTQRVCLDNGCALAHPEGKKTAAKVDNALDADRGRLSCLWSWLGLTWPTPLSLFRPRSYYTKRQEVIQAPMAERRPRKIVYEDVSPVWSGASEATGRVYIPRLKRDVQASCSLIIISRWLSALLSGCPILSLVPLFLCGHNPLRHLVVLALSNYKTAHLSRISKQQHQHTALGTT